MRIKLVERCIYRGEMPDDPTDFQILSFYKIKKILCLEAGWQAWFSGKMNWEINLANDNNIDLDNIRMSDFFAPSLEDLNTAACIINRVENHPIYVHCLHGVDRTGMCMAAWRIRFCNWDWQQARDEMYENGFHRFPYFWWVGKLKKYQKSIRSLK